MIRTGDVLQNPVTGETVHLVRSAADTGRRVRRHRGARRAGRLRRGYARAPVPDRGASSILEGEVGFKAGGKTIVAGPGETFVVEPGTAHRFWNNGDVPARFRCEVRPALQFEQLLATMYALAADGKTNRNGMPSPLRLAVIAKHHFDDVRLPFPPVWTQRVGLALGAPVGRLFGYRPVYEGAAPDEAALAL